MTKTYSFFIVIMIRLSSHPELQLFWDFYTQVIAQTLSSLQHTYTQTHVVGVLWENSMIYTLYHVYLILEVVEKNVFNNWENKIIVLALGNNDDTCLEHRIRW